MKRLLLTLFAASLLNGCATTPPGDRAGPKDEETNGVPLSRWLTIGESTFLYRDLTVAWPHQHPAKGEALEHKDTTVSEPLDRRLVTIGVYDVPFAQGSSALTDGGRQALEALLGDAWRAARIGLRGTAGGAEQASLRLAKERTETIAAYLMGRGINGAAIEIDPYDPKRRGRRVIVTLETADRAQAALNGPSALPAKQKPSRSPNPAGSSDAIPLSKASRQKALSTTENPRVEP